MTNATHHARLVLDLRAPSDLPDPALADVLCGSRDVACTLLSAPDHGSVSDDWTALVRRLQGHGVAVLIANDVDAALRSGADGVHLSGLDGLAERYTGARSRLKPDQIVGVEPDGDRHTAMSLAETGADYVAFCANSHRDVLLWWSEIFEVPCVALGVTSADGATVFARHGVEFLATSGDAELARTLDAAIRDVALEAEMS